MELVLEAISTLFSPQINEQGAAAADKFLREFMKSPDAWSVIPGLLTCTPSGLL